jgi:hypothetical protein
LSVLAQGDEAMPAASDSLLHLNIFRQRSKADYRKRRYFRPSYGYGEMIALMPSIMKIPARQSRNEKRWEYLAKTREGRQV